MNISPLRGWQIKNHSHFAGYINGIPSGFASTTSCYSFIIKFKQIFRVKRDVELF
jgi:hypothetical protein